jgi:hypothetical protein
MSFSLEFDEFDTTSVLTVGLLECGEHVLRSYAVVTVEKHDY